MATRYETGNLGEQQTAEFLTRNGYEIVCRNYRVKGGEIDIIARKDDVLCFVEVKTRAKNALVSAEKAVNKKKRRLLVRAAQRFLSEYGEDVSGRFDVSAIEVDGNRIVSLKYYVSAFDASDYICQ